MEDVEEKLRAILGDQGLGKLLGAFAAFDDNHDGKLSVKEASSSIMNLLALHSIGTIWRPRIKKRIYYIY